MSYQDELAYLYSLQQFGIKLGLSNIRELCSLLNNPQDVIKTIHVGGTNGKGSTAAILSSILIGAGYKVGLYTSPHLMDFTERIRINNIPVTQERALQLIREVRGRIEDRDIMPTFFEFTTALALLYFAEEDIDIAVMEVGMGGRLDATNIINPLVSIITNVDYDHTEHLGPSLERIAMEKCGIIKKGAPVVTSERKGDILSVIEDSAREAGTVAFVYGRDFCVDPVRLTQLYGEFYYNGLRWKGLLLNSPLPGGHQMFNTGVALYTTELLTEKGFDVTEEQVIAGVRNVSWPGRLETISGTPTVLLDGAHNHAGAVVLREFIEDILRRETFMRYNLTKEYENRRKQERTWVPGFSLDRGLRLKPNTQKGFSDEKGNGRIVLVFGVLKDKDVRSMIGELLPYSSEVVITRPDTDRGLQVERLQEIVEGYGIKPHVTRTVAEALSVAHDIASSSDTIIVTGSLYVVGEARTLILNELRSK